MALTRPEEKVQMLELPYTGGELSMLIYLPESRASAERLSERLPVKELTHPELRQEKVKVYLPRFRAETSYSLRPALMDLGMQSAFGAADFTGMSPEGKRLLISHVLHKAFVDVNEEGTEAAAATAVVLKEASRAPEEIVFRADHPFVFAIRENHTGTILFLGRYAGPQA
jgi:serpin B